MGAAAKEHIPALGSLLQDPDRSVRDAAARALGAIGAPAKEPAPALETLLRDPAVRWPAAQALEAMGPLNINDIVNVLSPVYDDAQQAGILRFLAHFLGGGDKEAEIVVQWLGRPDRYPEKVTHADSVAAVQVFKKI
jgi:HEAT repeat protein